MKLAGFLAAHARLTPDREAVRCGKEHLSFAQLHERSTQVANALTAHGVGIGDRVVIFLNNRVEFPVAFMGIVKAGAIAVTPNPRLSSAELAYVLCDAVPKAVIFEEETRQTLMRSGTDKALRICVDAQCEPREHSFATLAAQSTALLAKVPSEFDDCMISYTSGTTGKPKGAIITQANYITSNGFLNAQQWGMSTADRILTTTPLAHRSAFSRLMNVICLGSSIVFTRNFDPEEAVKVIQEQKITVLTMVPTVARMLLPYIEAAPEKFCSLRMTTVSAEAFPVELKHRVRNILPQLQIVSFFAMTEMGPITNLAGEEQFEKPASVGRVNPGVEVKLVNDEGEEVPTGEAGEILVRTGPPGRFITMRGYFNKPEATAETVQDGWVRTGDMGRFDEQGYLYIVDRKKDMVLSGGYNIYSKEVESAILEVPGIRDAAVVGVPDEVFGEAVAAFVEVEHGTTVTAELIIEHCRERIASYKKPKHIRFVTALPRNSTGKVLKYELREQFIQE